MATMERPKSLLQSEITLSQRSVGCHAAYEGKHSFIPTSSRTQAVTLQEPWLFWGHLAAHTRECCKAHCDERMANAVKAWGGGSQVLMFMVWVYHQKWNYIIKPYKKHITNALGQRYRTIPNRDYLTNRETK